MQSCYRLWIVLDLLLTLKLNIMTAIVGIICKKGVVVGADSSATFTNAARINTIEQKTRKIQIIGGKVILAGTGSFGLGQRFTYEVENVFTKSGGIKEGEPPVEICRKLSALGIKNFSSTGNPSGQYGSLLAFPCQNKFHLCEFDVPLFQPEMKTDHLWYVSMGSGQTLVDPFLGFIRKVFWRDGMPSLKEGIFATIWALQHAIELNPGGINGPIDVAILEYVNEPKIAARFLTDQEIEEHTNNINDLENRITEFWKPGSEPGEPAEIPKLNS